MLTPTNTHTMNVKTIPLRVPQPDTNAGRLMWSALLDVANLCLTAESRDRPEQAAELLTQTKRQLAALVTDQPARDQNSPHLTPQQAAAYLGRSLSWFRKRATQIERQPGTGRFRVEDLDKWAAKQKPRRKR